MKRKHASMPGRESDRVPSRSSRTAPAARSGAQAALPNRPPSGGEIRQMGVGVAVKLVDHRHALEIMTGGVFVGHADAAVKLDCLLPDVAAGAADLHLGGGDRLAALDRVFLGRHDGGEHRHAARLLDRDQHIDASGAATPGTSRWRGRTACGFSGTPASGPASPASRRPPRRRARRWPHRSRARPGGRALSCIRSSAVTRTLSSVSSAARSPSCVG